MSLRCKTCGRKPRRSNDANKRYWALLAMISDGVRPEDHQYGSEAWHLYFKARILGMDETRLPNGKVVTQPKSSADLDTGEFANYQEQVEAWAAERGVYLPDMEGT